MPETLEQDSKYSATWQVANFHASEVDVVIVWLCGTDTWASGGFLCLAFWKDLTTDLDRSPSQASGLYVIVHLQNCIRIYLYCVSDLESSEPASAARKTLYPIYCLCVLLIPC